MCGPEGYGFSAVLGINRVSILHSSLDMGMFLGRSDYFTKEDKENPFTNYVCGNLTVV